MYTLLKAKDVARILQIPRAAVLGLLRRGQLKGFKLGKGTSGWKVLPEELKKFILKNAYGRKRGRPKKIQPEPKEKEQLSLDFPKNE